MPVILLIGYRSLVHRSKRRRRHKPTAAELNRDAWEQPAFRGERNCAPHAVSQNALDSSQGLQQANHGAGR